MKKINCKKGILLLTLIGACLLTGCGSNNVYEGSKDGYSEASSVEGVRFEMPESFLSNSTAVSTLDDEEDYSKGTYLYKDGKTTYILFNVDQVVVTVQSGTSFHMSDTKDKTEALKAASINNTWFSPAAKKLKYDTSKKKGLYKLVAEVSADVSITQSVYGTYYGKFATIESGDFESSIFAGVPAESMKDVSSKQMKILNHIVKSFKLSDDANTNTVSKNAEKSDSSNSINPTVNAVTEETDTETEQAVTYSDLTHLLSIGDTGRLNALDNNGKKLDSTTITIEELYTGQEAADMIKDYCNSDAALYDYVAPQDGYTWHVIKYRTEKSPDDLYINIKLEGLDGGKLNYNGIVASSRTYDMFYKISKAPDGGYQDLYCYYAVPNGCKEYMLECGNRAKDTSETACYKISGY